MQKIKVLIAIMVLTTLAVIGITFIGRARKEPKLQPQTQSAQPAPSPAKEEAIPAPAKGISETDLAQALDFAKKEFAFANEIVASDWHKNSKLYGVVVDYKDSLSPAAAKDTYIYKATESKPFPFNKYYWTITMNQVGQNGGQWNRLIYPIEDYFLGPNLEEIPLQYWKLSFLEAIAIAEKNGGQDFRTKNKNYNLKAILSNLPGKDLTWRVSYKAEKDQRNFEISAATGDIL